MKVLFRSSVLRLSGTSIGIQGLWYLTEYNVGDGHLARYRVQVVVGKQF